MQVPKGDVLHQFRSDVENGKLPSVSWLVAPENFSDHPGAPWYGAWYVAEALNILTRNPEVWKKTIFILTYDENDGYFDHFPPFVAPDPKNPETGKTSEGLSAEADYLSLEEDLSRGKAEHPRGGPIGLGFRVPLVIASPWSRGGYVCSQVFDHTSVIRLLERVKAVREPNISPWRRTVCGDLSTVFRPFEEERQGPLTFPETKEFLEGIHKAQFQPAPSNYRKLSTEDVEAFGHDRYAAGWMAQQEPGVRRSVALPYELHAEGSVSKDGKQFELVLEAKKEGAPFHAYSTGKFRGKAELRTRAYAVAAGGRLADAWAMEGFAGGRYDLHVGGPNGFYRGFAGSAGDPAVRVACEYEASGDVRVRLRSERAQTVRIADHAYGGGTRTLQVATGRETAVVLPLKKSYHWYDFSVTVEGAAGYLRRFAGRVETGEHGFSDPAMGRVKTL